MGPAIILVVEDDDLSRDLLRLLLIREGYQVETAATGEHALSLLASSFINPTAVLTDLNLPGISGPALVAKLRQAASHAQILAMSGSQPDTVTVAAFDGFLLKPFSMASLAALLAARAPNSVNEEKIPGEVTRVIDPAVFEKLSAVMPPEKLMQLYRLCVEDTRKRIDRMRHAASGADDATYRGEAHAIKGGAGMLGVLQIKDLAGTQEDTGITTNYVATLDEILQAIQRLEDMLNANSTSPDTAALLRGPCKEQE